MFSVEQIDHLDLHKLHLPSSCWTMNISIGVGTLFYLIVLYWLLLCQTSGTLWQWLEWTVKMANYPSSWAHSCHAQFAKPSQKFSRGWCPWTSCCLHVQAPAVCTNPQYPCQNHANLCCTPARQPARNPLQYTAHCAKYWKCLIQTGHMLQLASPFPETVS